MTHSDSPAPARRPVLHFVAILFFLGGLPFVAGCAGESSGAPPGGMTVNVVAAPSEVRPVQEKISLVGTLAANEEVELKSELDGVVEMIGFEEGQTVEKGTVLFKIDEKKLRATLAQAKANLKLAQTTADRYKTLIESRAISRQEYDQAVAELEANRAEVELIGEQLNDATITAPFDGTTGERLVSIGQFITKGASLSFLINDNPVKAEFRLPERFLSRVKEGQTVQIRVAAYPGETFSGSVYFIDPRIEEATRTALMKAKIGNPDGRLMPGMFSNLDLIVSTRPEAVVIPETALMIKGDATSVFVIDGDNTAHRRPITPGTRLAGMVEVVEGLKPGEVVVAEGFQKLRDGASVNIGPGEETIEVESKDES